MLAEQRLQHVQRGADDLFQRLPLFTQAKTAGLDARHIQQVVHQPGGAQHLLTDLAGLGGVIGAFGRQIQRENFRLAEQHGQRGAQIVRQRRQQRVAQLFAFGVQLGFFGAARQVQPFQRAGDQHCEGLQQPLLFRHHQLAQVVGFDRQQAEGLFGGIERQQLVRHPGQGVGAGAGRQAFIETPARDGFVYRQQPAFLADHLLQPAVFLRQQQHGFRLEAAGEEMTAGVGDVGHGQRAAQPA
ncbi:Uncharacterised protein [Acinetobacter baumannii]|nr:Uncharacterised protein [Acinetobacter baumannii]